MMRCECCDVELNDVDATARFAESGNYVSMCAECRTFLPKDLVVVLRPDLTKKKESDDSDIYYDPFDLGDMDDESW
jgi:hypothetical protein